MAIVLVQSTKKIVTATTGSTTLAFGSNLAAGNLVCLAQSHFEAAANIAVLPTDTLSHVYTAMQADQVFASNNHLQCWYEENCSGGADTVTFDVVGGFGADFSMVIAEFSGVATTSSIDKTSPAGGNSTSVNSGATATTSQADELLWGAMTMGGGTQTITETGSATIMQEDENGSSNMPIAVSYRVVSSAAAYSATWTLGSFAADWLGQITTFKAAAAVAPQTYFPSCKLAMQQRIG